MILAQNRNINQWNKIDNPEISPHTCEYLIFDKGSKKYNGEKTASSISDGGKTGELHVGILPNTIHKNKLKMD